MYDLDQVKASQPTGIYEIAAGAKRECGEGELIAALDAIEKAKAKRDFALRQIISSVVTRLIAPSGRFSSKTSAYSG